MILQSFRKKLFLAEKVNLISKDHYEIFEGVKMYFYDRESIKAVFEIIENKRLT
jgi:hypothetical protein